MNNKQKILITTGPTREYLDKIRFITNESSGKMGFYLAEEARKYGFKTIIITGPTNIHYEKKVIKVSSAEEMLKNVLKYFRSIDVFISASAVSDWKFEKIYNYKIKKTKPFTVKLIPNVDILKTVSNLNSKLTKKKFLVGFALETENIVENAKKKLKEKRLDLIVANTYKSLGNNYSTGAIIDNKKNILYFKNLHKRKLAKKIIKIIMKPICYTNISCLVK